MATKTGELAAQAGSATFQVLKNGFWWVYNQIVTTVIPTVQENLPKIMFVINKKEEKKISLSSTF